MLQATSYKPLKAFPLWLVCLNEYVLNVWGLRGYNSSMLVVVQNVPCCWWQRFQVSDGLQWWLVCPVQKQNPKTTSKNLMLVISKPFHPRAQQLRLHFGRCEQFAHACGGFGLCGPELSLPRVLSPRQG